MITTTFKSLVPIPRHRLKINTEARFMKRSGTHRPKNKSLGDKGLGVQELHHLCMFFWGLPKQQRQQIQPHIRKVASFTSDDDIKGSICRFYFSGKKTNQYSLKEGHLQISARTIPPSCRFFIPHTHTNITSLVGKHHSKAPGTLLLLAMVFSQLQKVINICMPWLLVPDATKSHRSISSFELNC